MKKEDLIPGNIYYHDAGDDFKYIISFSHLNGRSIKGTACCNINSGYKSNSYCNTTIIELRDATYKEKELLYSYFPHLKINDSYEIY